MIIPAGTPALISQSSFVMRSCNLCARCSLQLTSNLQTPLRQSTRRRWVGDGPNGHHALQEMLMLSRRAGQTSRAMNSSNPHCGWEILSGPSPKSERLFLRVTLRSTSSGQMILGKLERKDWVKRLILLDGRFFVNRLDIL